MKYLLLAPAVIAFLLFTAWPLGELFRLATLDTNFIQTSFVGLANFTDLAHNADFLRAGVNSLGYIALLVPANVLAALVSALALYRMKRRWQDATRIVFYVPVLAAGMVIAQVWRWIFYPTGPVNWLLGNHGVNWFGSGLTAIPAVSLIVATAGLGTNFIIVLAAIQGIDVRIFDAARIDGASWRHIKWRIIVPIISPTLGLVALLSAIGAVQVFETIYALVPQTYAATMTFEIYMTSFQWSHYGSAAAQAIVLLAATVLLAVIKQRVERA